MCWRFLRRSSTAAPRVRIRNPYRGQLAGTKLRDHAERIAPVGLHPIARLLRNEGRRHHNALVPKIRDLPVQTIAGWPRLVTKRQPTVLGCELSHELDGCRRRVVDLAEEPHLARPPSLCNRDRITQLRRIKSHESFAMIAHDSPSLRGGSTRPIRATLAIASRVSRLRKERTYGLRSMRATGCDSERCKWSSRWQRC
jgi:hypothetical protein